METVIPILAGVVGLAFGFILSKMFQQYMDAKRRSEAGEHIQQLTQNAQREAENLVKEAKIESKDLLFQAKSELAAKEKEKRNEIQQIELTSVRISQNSHISTDRFSPGCWCYWSVSVSNRP